MWINPHTKLGVGIKEFSDHVIIISMAYRNILSQMFDVRPLKASGDLDLERIKKIQHILDLAKKTKVYLKLEKDYEANRVINLRKKIEQKIIAAPAKKLKRDKKSFQIFSDEQVLKSLVAGNNSVEFEGSSPEIYESSLPSREEILATLEEIEKIDRYLEEHGLEIETETPQLEELKSEIEELKADIFDLDKYLSPAENDVITIADQELAVEPVLSEAEIPLRTLSAQVSAEEKEVYFDRSFLEQAIEKEPELSASSNLIKNFFDWVSSKIYRRENIETHKRSFVWRAAGFISAGFFIWLVVFGLSLAGRGLSAKDSIMSSGLEAYRAMLAGKDSAANLDFSAAQVNFASAYQNFLEADQQLNKMGRVLISILEKLPGGSAVQSGAALIDAGKNLALTGQSFSRIGGILGLEKIGDYFSGAGESLTQKMVQIKQELKTAETQLESANSNLSKVNSADLPSDLAPSIDSLKEKLPTLAAAVAQVNDWSDVFLEIFGHQLARKYLLVFQNNAEARPTGGFIGTYGILDLDEGRITNLFVDNVFNLDGQLYEKIIPPKPIQKISTAWSLHDANWFADWPTSAQKIIEFYEKAGGATADGVISLTPTAIERLLAITGPIDLPEFNVTLTQDNFTDIIQYKVEADYDKEINQPKKILADFMPKFLDRLWEIWPQKYNEIFEVLNGALAEKHILFYFSDPALEKIFNQQGWTGEILSTDKDYLSVINTNINGFKTDRVVEQKIYHSSQVQPDGTIVDTVKIVRTHKGGKSQYDWYNKANADYLRVYVPLGSKLLAAQGQTLEAYSAPADYQKLNFKTDPDVAAEEQNMSVDPNSGTQIFSESGKTVFGNWAYVSPGETVEITYKYLLPFKLNLSADNFSWSLLAQKQSGSIGSDFESTLTLPQEFKINWQYPDNLQISGSQIKFTSDLKTDKFYGIVLGK